MAIGICRRYFQKRPSLSKFVAKFIHFNSNFNVQHNVANIGEISAAMQIIGDSESSFLAISTKALSTIGRVVTESSSTIPNVDSAKNDDSPLHPQ